MQSNIFTFHEILQHGSSSHKSQPRPLKLKSAACDLSDLETKTEILI